MFLLLSLILNFLQPVPVTHPTCNKAFQPESGVLFKFQQNSWQDLSRQLPEKINPISFWAEKGQYFLGASEGLFTANGLIPIVQWQKSSVLEKDIIGIFPGHPGPYAVALWHGIYQYDPALSMWRAMSYNLPEKTVFSLQETSNGMLFAGSESGIYRSVDHGSSWEHIFSRGQVSHFICTDQELIVCYGKSIWRSADNGENWDQVLTQTTRAAQIKKIPLGLIAFFDGQEFGGVRIPNGLFLSKDNGISWDPYVITRSPEFHDIYEIETLGNDLYAISKKGIFHSSDQGKTWNPSLLMPADTGGFFKMTVSEGILYALVVKGC